MKWIRSILPQFRPSDSSPEEPAVVETFAQCAELRPTLARGAIYLAGEAIAGFAWLNYSDGPGRGVVWVKQSIGCYGDELLGALREMIYIPQDRIQQLVGTPDDPLTGAVQQYDPEKEILVVVHQDQQSEFFISLTPNDPPPLAGDRMRAFLQGVSRDCLSDDVPFGHVAALYHAAHGGESGRTIA
jgi:hypothetical protein